MTEEEYKVAIEQYKAEHSAGGSLEHGEWKKHKYIRIENGRYIYPEDLKKETRQKLNAKLAEQNDRFLATDNTKFREMHNAVSDKKNQITDENSLEKDKEIDKKLDDATREKVVKATKEVIDEVSSDSLRTIKYWLKGFMEEDTNLFNDLDKSIDHHYRAKNIDLDKISPRDYVDSDEVLNLIEKRVIKGLQDFVKNGDTSDCDPKRLKKISDELNDKDLMAEIEGFFKMNRPFANKEAEDDAIRKKIQHSYTDSKSFYAAVYDYKQAHKR
ncbi:MAG: hypothetical protein J6Y02_08360 [Pseudobutyrivibrio sp.]|nr:hypothetical protein [Pseudobutyrivibrio sp.]